MLYGSDSWATRKMRIIENACYGCEDTEMVQILTERTFTFVHVPIPSVSISEVLECVNKYIGFLFSL